MWMLRTTDEDQRINSHGRVAAAWSVCAQPFSLNLCLCLGICLFHLCIFCLIASLGSLCLCLLLTLPRGGRILSASCLCTHLFVHRVHVAQSHDLLFSLLLPSILLFVSSWLCTSSLSALHDADLQIHARTVRVRNGERPRGLDAWTPCDCYSTPPYLYSVCYPSTLSLGLSVPRRIGPLSDPMPRYKRHWAATWVDSPWWHASLSYLPPD